MLNTLKYAKILEESGLTRSQAEAHMQIITAVVEEDMATKNDIKELRLEMQAFKNEIIVKLGVLITVVLPITLALLQFLHKS